MTATLQLDVWSDIACPWCFIGKRRLDRAIAQRPELDVDVRYHAFELRPQLPAEGVERKSFYEEMFGSEQAMRQALARVQAEGDSVGIKFAWEEMPKAPNTRLAHRALETIRASEGNAKQADAKERLFEAFFVSALDITDPDVVTQAAGVDPREHLEADAEVEADELLAHQLRIRGVPFFVAGKRLGLSGAQQPEIFLRFLDQAASEATAA